MTICIKSAVRIWLRPLPKFDKVAFRSLLDLMGSTGLYSQNRGCISHYRTSGIIGGTMTDGPADYVKIETVR